MSSPWLLTIALSGLIALAGCGGGGGGAAKEQTGGATATPAGVSKYDQGPRAAETPVDHELAEKGEELFKSKGCSACHAFGKKVTGPDLAGASQRRTSRWLEAQILHPDLMVKEDPIARQLFAAHALQMPKQGLSAEEARAVIEYLKHQDHEASEKH